MEKTRAIILVGHGNLPEEMKNSIHMITGQSQHMYAIGLNMEGNTKFEGQLKDVLEITSKYHEVVIFADLYGGSPCNSTFKEMCEKQNYHLISGMNLAMVLSAELNEKEEICSLVNIGKEAVKDVLDIYRSMESEED